MVRRWWLSLNIYQRPLKYRRWPDDYWTGKIRGPGAGTLITRWGRRESECLSLRLRGAGMNLDELVAEVRCSGEWVAVFVYADCVRGRRGRRETLMSGFVAG